MIVAFIESHVGYLSLEVRFDCTQGLSRHHHGEYIKVHLSYEDPASD